MDDAKWNNLKDRCAVSLDEKSSNNEETRKLACVPNKSWTTRWGMGEELKILSHLWLDVCDVALHHFVWGTYVEGTQLTFQTLMCVTFFPCVNVLIIRVTQLG